MRLLLLILAVLVAIVCIEKPAAADRQWCAYYDGCGGEPRIAGFQHINNAWRPLAGLVRRVGPIHSTKACRGPLRLGA
jgi:hypothetical protein